MIELDGISVGFVVSLEVSEENTVFVKGSISPVHVLPFSTGDEPAKNVIELFPNKSSSIDEDIVQAKDNSLSYVFDRLFQRCVFVKNKYDQENGRECNDQGCECSPV
jgi:hypothetical protein